MAVDLTDPVSSRTRRVVLSICVLAVAGLTICERSLGPKVPLASLFFLPLLVAAAFVPRWTIFLLAIALVLEREIFGPFAWDQSAPVRVSLSLVAFTGAWEGSSRSRSSAVYITVMNGLLRNDMLAGAFAGCPTDCARACSL
jgi:hypothetical protein